MEMPPLQAIRVPAGWMVEYNDLREVDPSPQSIDSLLLREDLLQLRHPWADVLIDVGWYGDAESGEFAVYVQAGDFRGERLHEFHSRDRLAVVTEVERLLRSPGRIA
jgi:hypothetical protein